MKLKILFAVFVFLFLNPKPALAEENRQFITIVNPIRISTYTQNLEANLVSQYKVISEKNLSATWLLTYDVLENPKALTVVKEMNENQELGIFLEITPNFAQKAGVAYNKTASWHFATSVFLSGYTQAEREKFIDTVFEKFKEELGFYPTSVGSWWTDAYSLSYMREKYGVTANLGVADQYATDNYQIWGTYWSTPYYPSRFHAGIPASDMSVKLDLLMLQWAPRDPVNGYQSSLYSTQDYKVLKEPLGTDYFEKLVRLYAGRHENEFGHAVIGLESDLSPQTYEGEFKAQMEVARRLGKDENFQVVPMNKFSEWYREQFPKFSPPHSIKTKDLLGENKEIIWQQTPKYRLGLIREPGETKIFDLRVYNKNSQEPYYYSPNREFDLSVSIFSLFDEFIDENNVWRLPPEASIIFQETGFRISPLPSTLPKVLTKASFVKTRNQNGGLVVEFKKDDWFAQPGGKVFRNLAIETIYLFKSPVNILKLFLGQGWDQLRIERYYLAQGELEALFRLSVLPWGKVLVYDKECLQCAWHTPAQPAAFFNLRNYVRKYGKKPIVRNQKVFEAKNQIEARAQFDESGAEYIYLAKYEDYVEKTPFSPGDLGIKKVYDNANAEVWRRVE